MDEIKVVIVDDHPLFRQGVVDTISLEDDIVVIGQADNGVAGLAIIQELCPHVAILDVNLPGINGLLLTRKIVAINLPTKVILITAYDDKEQVIHAMRYGASAFQTKNIKPEELVKTVRSAAVGKYVVEGITLNKAELELWIQNRIDDATRSFSDPGEPFRPLSNREMEVLSYLTRGMSNKELSEKLGISLRTVKAHMTNIFNKLGCSSRTDAIIKGLKQGYIDLDDIN